MEIAEENKLPLGMDVAEVGEEDEDEEDECMWVLGFVEQPLKRQSLLRHRFPSKVGGRPAWLDPMRLPSPGQMLSVPDGRPLSFLLQVYAPVSEVENAFHRSIFLFIEPKAHPPLQRGSVRAFRCQLPRINPHYPPAPPSESDCFPPPSPEPAHPDPWHVRECEAELRRGLGGSLALPGALDMPGSDRPCFPELELLTEEEEEEDEASSAALLAGAAARGAAADREETAERAAASPEQPAMEDMGLMMDAVEAKATQDQRDFAHFSARLARDPEQCLRYCFEEGARPLWPLSRDAPGDGDVPPCPACGGARRFEFQVMPQLLNHLGLDHASPDALDWGMLAVYTCASSCGNGGGHAEEFVWVAHME